MLLSSKSNAVGKKVSLVRAGKITPPLVRKQLIAQRIASHLETHPLSLILTGPTLSSAVSLPLRENLTNQQFTLRMVKSSTFRAAANFYINDRSKKDISPAKILSRKAVYLLFSSAPIFHSALLDKKMSTSLNKTLEGAGLEIVGAFVKDAGKTRPNIFMVKAQMESLLGQLSELKALRRESDDKSNEAHEVLYLEAIRILTESLSGVSNILNATLQNLNSTLSFIKDKDNK